VLDIDGGTIQKTYTTPGNYDVTLRVINRFGEDTVIFFGFINARVPAPDEAVILIDERSGQIGIPGTPSGGPYTTPPTIKSPVDTFMDMSIPSGENPSTPGRSWAGELLDGAGEAIDPITDYNWQLSDDLVHENAPAVRASYSIGGLYDIILRADTEFGAYRITTYEDSIDIVERVNLWLWTFTAHNKVVASEFGLISETFKTRATPLVVNRNSDFLEGEANADQLVREFERNVFFSPRSTTPSGDLSHGTSLLYWASGRDAAALPTTEKINIREFNAFEDTYITPAVSSLSRPWNWTAFNILGSAYFILGNVTDSVIPPFTSPTNQEKLALNVVDLTTTAVDFEFANYLNGADELQQNVANYDPTTGEPIEGHFSVYRATTKNDVGYFARNDGVGAFFRIKSFYRTEGVLSDPLQNIKKLTDIAGSTKLEGQLVPLTSAIYFLNNSSDVSAYNDASDTWETGVAGTNSVAFSLLQDREVPGFSNTSQTLLATSDGDRRAYMSFDYSPNSFIKFNEADLTFSSLGSRPEGQQWMMSIY
jgi:PKD repeat protein